MPAIVNGKRIVLTTWGSYGDLHPYMALALELKKRGHRPVIGTFSLYREKIEKAGIEFRLVRPDTESPDDNPELLKRAIAPRTGAQVIFGEMLLPYIRESYADTLKILESDGGADLVVTHVLTFGAHLAAETTGVRWVSTVLSPIALMSAYDPPTPPIFGGVQRIARMHPVIGRTLVRLARWGTASMVRPVRVVRSELGLPPRGHPLFDGQHSPNCVLALYSPLMGKVQPDFPPHTVVTGFPFYDRDADRGEMTAPLRRFLDDCDTAGEPPIVFTLGSSAIFAAGDFYRTATEAVGRLGRNAILLIGDARNLPSGTLPSNVAVFDYAPYSELLPRCALTVHQGGVGTTAQALRSGRPMLVMPFGHDTLDNARRAAELGVARVLKQRYFTPARLSQTLAEMSDDADLTARAAAVGERVRGENGTAAACDQIERVLSQ